MKKTTTIIIIIIITNTHHVQTTTTTITTITYSSLQDGQRGATPKLFISTIIGYHWPTSTPPCYTGGRIAGWGSQTFSIWWNLENSCGAHKCMQIVHKNEDGLGGYHKLPWTGLCASEVSGCHWLMAVGVCSNTSGKVSSWQVIWEHLCDGHTWTYNSWYVYDKTWELST